MCAQKKEDTLVLWLQVYLGMKQKITQNTAVRFALVGVVNTLFGTAVMFLAYNLLGCSYWMSSAANYVFGSILSYFLNKYFTFRSSGKSWAEIGRFVVSILFCYLMAYGVAKWATNELLSSCNVSLRENISMAVGMVLFVVLNYVLQRLFVFKNKKQ